MTLYTLVNTIKEIALKQPNVGSANEGNVYEINSNPSVQYANVTITQDSHTQDEMYDHYGFTIFYIDRLVDNMEANRLQIQSIGKEVLSNIITILEETYDVEHQEVRFQPFTQKFVDETAGIYVSVTFDTIREIICGEDY